MLVIETFLSFNSSFLISLTSISLDDDEGVVGGDKGRVYIALIFSPKL